MNRATIKLWIVWALCIASACGGDDGGSKATGDGGAPEGVTGAQRDGGSAGSQSDGGPSSSLACIPAAQATLGGCTQTQIEEIGSCLETACKSELAGCYGPNHTSGKFSGPCATEGQCSSKCRCGDSTCYDACPTSAECTDCGRSFVACGTQCIGKLGCALGFQDGGLGAAFDEACDALEKCCASLTDGAAKRECVQSHQQVKGSGGLICLLVIPLFCS